MFLSSTRSVFFIFLHLICLAFTQDPTCTNGIQAGKACCPLKCRQCGGIQCGRRSNSFKTICCTSTILNPLNNISSCNITNAPCILSSGNVVKNKQLSTLFGKWKYANVRSGELIKRHEACAVMVKGKVVLIGGRGKNKPVSIYNPKNEKWINKKGPGKNIELHHFQCVVIQYKIWIVSSWTGKFPFEKNTPLIYIYNMKNDKWTTKKGMQKNRLRGGAATVRKGNWIYVIGGNRGGHGEHAKSLNWMDVYNWKVNKWLKPNTFPNLPGPARDHVGAAIIKNHICIAGGRNGGSKQFFFNTISSTWCFNLATRKWLRKQNFPVGRAGAMTATTCDGKMMIAGGEGHGKAYDRVDVFDLNHWKQAPSLKHARHGSGLAVAHCHQCAHIFIPSGSGRQGGSPELLTTEQYIPKNAPRKCSKY